MMEKENIGSNQKAKEMQEYARPGALEKKLRARGIILS
jgi:hypothetical protein